MKCPICSGETIRLFQTNGYWIRECIACGHRLADIMPEAGHVGQVYGDHYFFGDVDGYPDYLSEEALLTATGRRYGQLVKSYLSPGTLLDVGCAAGFLSKGFQEAGWEVLGLEPNARMAEHARQQGIEVITGSLEDFHTIERFDLIVMIQVVPHLFNLHNALDAAVALTKPGGFWLIETWDRDSLTARIFGHRWHEYSPPSVLHYFSREGLGRLVQRYGFDPIAHGRPIKRLNGQHAKSLLKHNLSGEFLSWLVKAGIILIPDTMVLPYPSFDLFWMLAQKS